MCTNTTASRTPAWCGRRNGPRHFFGGDPDNFNFPRYDLDISLLRVYENGKPAVIKDYFPFSKNGAQDAEMVFVTGQPGRTQRQLTLSQLATLRDTGLIPRLLQLSELRGVMEQYAKTGPEAARLAEAELFGVENGFKVFKGQLETMLDPALMKKKSRRMRLRCAASWRPGRI
ncbi:S46 family peptidase [Undibacterium arcticum]